MNKILLIVFALVCFVILAFATNEYNDTESVSVKRSKREPVSLLVALTLALIGAGAGAAAGYGFAQLSPPAASTCNIAIASTSVRGSAYMHFNFVSFGDDCNENDEMLSGRDTTKERIDGGRLRFFTVRTHGTFCLEYLAFRCGNDVTGVGEKSIILDHASFPWYHCMMHKWWRDPVCVWFSASIENIGNFYVNSDIFHCGERDSECHKYHIGSAINGCVDMTGGKFDRSYNQNRCS